MSAERGLPILRRLHEWDARLLGTDTCTPAGARCTVLTWHDPAAVDGGVPASLALPLARGLVELGEVAFRATKPPPNVRLLGRIPGQGASRIRSWHVVASSDAGTVAIFLDEDWSQGDQTVVIGAANDERARRLLAADRLDRFSIEEGELIVAAIVDGAGALICSSSDTLLKDAIQTLHCHVIRYLGVDMEDILDLGGKG